jgi:hypothetical protein
MATVARGRLVPGEVNAKTTPPRRGTTPNAAVVVMPAHGLTRLSPAIPIHTTILHNGHHRTTTPSLWRPSPDRHWPQPLPLPPATPTPHLPTTSHRAALVVRLIGLPPPLPTDLPRRPPCRRSRLRWPHGDGLHASGLADGRDVQPPCWPHAVVLLRHRGRERLHHAAVGVAHSPRASSPPAPDLTMGGPNLPHTTPTACSRVRRAPLGLLHAHRANLRPAAPATVPARSGMRATDPDTGEPDPLVPALDPRPPAPELPAAATSLPASPLVPRAGV